MTKFHVFGEDQFFGTYEAVDAHAAMQACADAVGTDGNTDGMVAYADGENEQADACAAAA